MDEKKTELWVAVAGVIGTTATALLGAGIIPDGSVVAVIVGVVATVCAYIAQRGFVKGKKLENLTAAGISYRADDAKSIRTQAPQQ
jgi:hypothetical protein